MGKGRKTVSRAGARRLGQLSSPTPSLVRHLRTPILLTSEAALTGQRVDKDGVVVNNLKDRKGKQLTIGKKPTTDGQVSGSGTIAAVQVAKQLPLPWKSAGRPRGILRRWWG